MLASPFAACFLYAATLFAPLQIPDPKRDWRWLEEFTEVKVWYPQSADGDQLSCYEYWCPQGTPERMFAIAHLPNDCITDHAEIGQLDTFGLWTGRRLECSKIGRGEWRVVVGDWYDMIPDGEAFMIRVWVIRCPGEVWGGAVYQ